MKGPKTLGFLHVRCSGSVNNSLPILCPTPMDAHFGRRTGRSESVSKSPQARIFHRINEKVPIGKMAFEIRLHPSSFYLPFG